MKQIYKRALAARRDGTCHTCRGRFPAGTTVLYIPEPGLMLHVACWPVYRDGHPDPQAEAEMDPWFDWYEEQF